MISTSKHKQTNNDKHKQRHYITHKIFINYITGLTHTSLEIAHDDVDDDNDDGDDDVLDI